MSNSQGRSRHWPVVLLAGATMLVATHSGRERAHAVSPANLVGSDRSTVLCQFPRAGEDQCPRLRLSSDAPTPKPKVEEGKKTINGADLYYKSIGAGETIIVLHGGPGLDHTCFLPQFERLARDYRLLFYDQRACGKSTGALDEKSMNIDTFVEDLDVIRRAFKIEKANVLGFSWGGLLAMHYVIKHPDQVARLILVNSTEARSAESANFGKVLAQRRSDTEKKELAAIRTSPEYLAGDPKAVTASLRLGFRAYCFNPGRAKEITLDFSPKSANAFVQVGDLFDKTLFDKGYDLHPKLKRLTCPTLIVHGDTDPIDPKYLKAVSDEIKGAEFVLLQKCGHFSYIEQPDKLFLAITKFMSQ